MKNSYLSALLASAYIAAIVGVIWEVGHALVFQDTVLIPMIMLALLVLSAAVMGYLFLYHPLTLYFEGKREEAVHAFFKTVGAFAAITLIAFVIITLTKSAKIASVTYICDKGHTIAATYYAGKPYGSVRVTPDDDGTATLKQTISGSGVRYANADESYVFWNKGDTAILMRNNIVDLNYTSCSIPSVQ